MDQYMQRIPPYEGNEPYLFVSYSHRDSNRVLPLLHRLKNAGFRFWYDEGIDPGTEWPESIATHLERSKVCLAFISPEYVISNNCRREINFALSRNLDFLSVILEPTQMTSGMEMQISSYMSLVAYKYPSQEEFFEKLCNVEILQKCRGPVQQEAVIPPTSEQAVTAEPISPKLQKKKNNLWLKILVPFLSVLLIAGFLLFGRISKPNEPAPDSLAESAQSETSIGSPSLSASPSPTAEEPIISEESIAPETQEILPETVESADQEGYRTLLYGEWTYGSIAVFASSDKTFHVELKDNRVPYGYPMSETPGNNEASWNVQFIMSMRDNVFIDLKGDENTLSLQKLNGNMAYTIKGGFQYGGSLKYVLEDNTFKFDVTMTDSFPYAVDDLQMVYVNLGTQAPGYSDHYDFYPD